ncbi:hypothetical protein [Halobacillus litoralis]|uniref:hypothetical protein n=1 Tax=Halobacillus litoralis TaxID=45668 RepID=UPI001CFED3A3|nr:hypothetical protein [Halobacillus litoralis]
MKNIFWSTGTVMIMLLINWGVAELLEGKFLEYSFLIGVMIIGLVQFFNSKGGYSSNRVRLRIQARTGMKMEEEKREFNPTVVFYTTIGYTVAALILTIIYYKDYFIG